MAWRLARSLDTLRAEVNAFAPNRSKRSDGTLGDPAHQSRASRHNKNRYGVVCAFDATHDPEGGFDAHGFARRHVLDPHPELEYVISDGRIAKRRTGFAWEIYRGSNPHRLHVHFAVGRGPDSDPLPPYDSTLSWGVSLTPPEDDDMTPEQAKKLDALEKRSLAADQRLDRIEKALEKIAGRQVPEETIRQDIRLNRLIAEKVGVET